MISCNQTDTTNEDMHTEWGTVPFRYRWWQEISNEHTDAQYQWIKTDWIILRSPVNIGTTYSICQKSINKESFQPLDNCYHHILTFAYNYFAGSARWMLYFECQTHCTWILFEKAWLEIFAYLKAAIWHLNSEHPLCVIAANDVCAELEAEYIHK